jgi:carboxyl-terminal processing protease
MTDRISRAARPIFLLAALVGLFAAPGRLAAEPNPGKRDALVAQMVCAFVQRAHLARPDIDDDVSRRFFKHFLKDLDPAKLYFLQSDIEDLRKYETELDDQVLKGDVGFAYKVYERFMTRANERLKLIEELVKAPQDFTVKEYLSTDYDKIDFAKDENELKDRWRKRIKFDLLLHRIGEKPLPDDEARKKVLHRYQGLVRRYKQLDNYDLLELYLSSLTSSLDPHSTYMGPNTVDDFDIAMRLNLEGIGAVLRQDEGYVTVAEVVPGGPASKDGRLKANDKIIGVAQGDGNFTDVVDAKLREAVKLIRGKRGTTVELKVIPAGKLEPVVYQLTRQKIELKSQEARSEIIEDGKRPDGTPYRVGVIDLPSFYADMKANGGGKSATEDVRKILKDFADKKVDAVVLDLRHNGGGALSEALSLTGLFIDQGPVVQVKDPKGGVQHRDDPEPGTVYGGPLVVLTSRMSASASEILAGALQDYGRALVVGDSATHGKGTVQMMIDLGSHLPSNTPLKLGALKLTIQQFYRVNGDSTQKRGIAADIILPSVTEALVTGENDLEHALAFDRVAAVEHEQYGLVPVELKTALKKRSAERVDKSPEFAKLAKDVERLKARKARKSIPLSEEELKTEFGKDAEKAEREIDGGPTPEPEEKGAYKFRRTYINNEILQITEDFAQGKRLLSAR